MEGGKTEGVKMREGERMALFRMDGLIGEASEGGGRDRMRGERDRVSPSLTLLAVPKVCAHHPIMCVWGGQPPSRPVSLRLFSSPLSTMLT